jgi:hypothetical protein
MSPYNIYSLDADSLLTLFDTRMKRLLKDPKNFAEYTDEQMELLENTVLPAIQQVLEVRDETPVGHA